MDISKIATKDLVEELERREGVFVTVVAPHEDTTIQASGPAIVLTVID